MIILNKNGSLSKLKLPFLFKTCTYKDTAGFALFVKRIAASR